MSDTLFYIAIAACLITLVVLMVGIGGFGTGKASPRFSNKMMRLRIVAQAIAVLFIVLAVWARRSGG